MGESSLAHKRWSQPMRNSHALLFCALCLFPASIPAEENIKLIPKGDAVRITEGTVWCIPVWDGNHIVVGTESRKGLILQKYTRDLVEVGVPVIAATPADTRDRQHIADHKH